MADRFDILPLHTRWDLLESCVVLLNSEWKRSAEARAHSLRKCSDDFPISLVMIHARADGVSKRSTAVVGHSRLTFIPGKPGACWVESVVVDKSLRGKGCGRILMAGTEDYARRRGFTELFLATHDAEKFYLAIGYRFCPAVVTMGSAAGLLQSAQATQLLEKMSLANSRQETPTAPPLTVPVEPPPPQPQPPALPPPPPPPAPPLPGKTSSSYRPVIEHHPSVTVYYMTKNLNAG